MAMCRVRPFQTAAGNRDLCADARYPRIVAFSRILEKTKKLGHDKTTQISMVFDRAIQPWYGKEACQSCRLSLAAKAEAPRHYRA